MDRFDVVIIGGGPAGLTAGLYAKRMGKSALVIEGEVFGGQITASPKVENFPGQKSISGNEFADALLNQVLSLEVQVELDNIKSITRDDSGFKLTGEYKSYQGKSVILAIGCKHRHLGVDNEERFVGGGVSYCAVCDGVFFRNKAVAVVGGGNAALQEAVYLSSICEKVYLVHRRDAFRGDENLVRQLQNKANVEMVLDSVITELKGEQKVSAIVVKNVKDGAVKEIQLSGVFVAIGQVPNTKIFEGFIQLNEGGYVAAGEDCRTSEKGVFTAGDCRVKEVNQLTTAVADGAVSAVNACKYVDSL